MNTDTGRIYDLHKLGVTREDLSAVEEGGEFTAFFSPAEKMLTVEQEREELLRAVTAGKAVEVSADVAHTMKLGQRERERRAKRRKAAKEARKRNR